MTVASRAPGMLGGMVTIAQLPFQDITLDPYRASALGDVNAATHLQTLVTDGDVFLPRGTLLLNSGMTAVNPLNLRGRRSLSIVQASNTFTAEGTFLTLSPSTVVERRGWYVGDFTFDNAGTNVKNVIVIDLTLENQYLSKLKIANVIADTVTDYFVKLVNPTNVDGLFTSVFEDNWSLNGYYLERIGDSVVLQRNTVTGAGVSVYLNQVSTAAHVILRDNNMTSVGGALDCVKSASLVFENNQVEVAGTFTGVNSAAVSLDGDGVLTHWGAKIRNNNINCQSNATLRCIYLEFAAAVEIEGNNLYCHPSTGTHIYIDANARDVYVGNNQYFSTVDGSDIAARITDNGQGTMGIWKTASLTTTWTLTDPTDGFPVGYFKDKDGTVHLRGRIGGGTFGAPELLFTLPIGFRPKAKVVAAYQPQAGGVNVYIQIDPVGQVYLITTGVASVNLTNFSFSTR